MKKAFSILSLLFLFCAQMTWAQNVGTLHVVDISPPTPDSYMRQNDFAVIRESVDLAAQDYKKEHPACQVATEFALQNGSLEDLYGIVGKISDSAGRKVAIGFSRSAAARIAAKAASGSDLIGISFSAAATDLRRFGSHFVSLSRPQDQSWKVWNEVIAAQGCSAENTLGIFNERDIFSYNYKNYYLASGYRKTLNVSSDAGRENWKSTLLGNECVILAMTLTNSRDVLLQLFDSGWNGKIFGVGEWVYYKNELMAFAKTRKNRKVRIFTPLTEEERISHEGQVFVKRLTGKVVAPSYDQAVDAYNATKMALDYLCENRSPDVFDKERIQSLGLLREFIGISESGNYLTPQTMRYSEF